MLRNTEYTLGFIISRFYQILKSNHVFINVCDSMNYIVGDSDIQNVSVMISLWPAPNRWGVGALSDDICLSVCLSRINIGPKSRTERPMKTKIGTEIAHVTRDSDIPLSR